MTPTAQRSRGGVLLRGLVSLVGILLILVGLPIALIVLGGNPLPAEVPSGDEVIRALTTPDDGTLLIGVITVVGWLVWATLALSFIVEVPAVIRGVPAPRLPGLSWQQGRAAAMTAAVVAMIAIATGAATPAGAVQVDQPSPGATTTSASPFATMGDAGASTVGVTASTADGATRGAEGHIVTVQSGDTLWGIADRELGDGDRYPQIAEASAGVAQPDGGELTSADDIRPGWQVMVPVDAQPSPPPAVPTETQSALTDIEQQLGGDAAPGAQDGLAAPTTTPEGDAATDAALPPVQVRPAAEETESATPGSAREAAEPRPAVDAPSPGLLEEQRGPSATLGLGLLGGAGLLAVVEARRRRQHRSRLPGWRVVVPSGAAARAEQWLRSTTDADGHEDMDAALTTLAERSAPGAVPSLRAARLGRNEIEVYVVEEDLELPAPWVGAGSGTWVLDRQHLHDSPVRRRSVWPALVTIGEDEDGARIFINLDEIGALELVGRPHETLGVLAAIAVDLGTSDVALTRVTAVGALDDLVDAIGDPRVTHAAGVAEVLARLDSGGAREGVEVVLMGTDLMPDETRHLRALVAAAHGRLAVVSTARGVADWSLSVESHRSGLSGVLAPVGMALRPTALTRPGYDEVIELLRSSSAPAVPGPEWTGGTPFDLLTIETVPRRQITQRAVDADEATANISQLRTERSSHVRVLGRPEVTGLGTPPPDRHRATELATLLALHPGSDASGAADALGVTVEELAWAAHQVDRWLGQGSGGVAVQAGRYALTDVLLDWQQLRALVGAALDAAVGANLRAALTLVSAAPFAEVTPGTFEWARADRAEMRAAVADIAHELAQRHLREGDPDGASWAARKGLLAEPLSEMLWRDQLHAAWQAQDTDQVRDAVTRSREALGDLGGLQDETTFVLQRIGGDLGSR